MTMAIKPQMLMKIHIVTNIVEEMKSEWKFASRSLNTVASILICILFCFATCRLFVNV